MEVFKELNLNSKKGNSYAVKRYDPNGYFYIQRNGKLPMQFPPVDTYQKMRKYLKTMRNQIYKKIVSVMGFVYCTVCMARPTTS